MYAKKTLNKLDFFSIFSNSKTFRPLDEATFQLTSCMWLIEQLFGIKKNRMTQVWCLDN